MTMERFLMKRIKTLAKGRVPGKVIGMVLATRLGLGYCVANEDQGDKYNEKRAYEICTNRMAENTIEEFEKKYYNELMQKNMNMVKYIHNELVAMDERASRYFKDEYNG